MMAACHRDALLCAIVWKIIFSCSVGIMFVGKTLIFSGNRSRGFALRTGLYGS